MPLVENLQEAERCEICRESIIRPEGCEVCQRQAERLQIMAKAQWTPMWEQSVVLCFRCGQVQVDAETMGYAICEDCLIKLRVTEHYHCNDCGQIIPEYKNMGVNGYESQTQHLHEATISGYAGVRAIKKRLCRDCYRKDMVKKYPDAKIVKAANS